MSKSVSRVNLINEDKFPNPKKKTLTPTLMIVFEGLNECIMVMLRNINYQNEKKYYCVPIRDTFVFYY